MLLPAEECDRLSLIFSCSLIIFCLRWLQLGSEQRSGTKRIQRDKKFSVKVGCQSLVYESKAHCVFVMDMVIPALFFFEGIAKHIASSGYGVYAIDHPGFGLSEGLHGYVPSFDGVVDNVIEQYMIIKGRPEIRGLPCFIFGQSMGGAIALKALLKEPRQWDGIVLVAPMCKIAEDMTPPVPLQKVLIFLSKIIPQAKLVPQKDLADLAFRELKKKEMAPYNVISYSDQTRLKTAVELLNATKYIESHVQEVASPILILHGAADRVTDPQVSQFLYDNASSEDKTLKLYDGGYHCILEGEPDDRILTVLGDIISWLDTRCSLK
ncbi:alpha/beta-Hydrolases superfamily protein [Abeliophyllum distichum]|uniref:Alpha/beta-Hydrolases superfamily protein n=1 Tax=Abeliophyllum distichum TaxID=126358 RepID=A0ABD1VZ34_9LAMI